MAQVKKSSAPCHTHLLSAMHMMSKMELTSKELEPVKVSRLPTTVITANGSIDTAEEDTVYVKDLDMSVTVQLLEDTPAVLFMGKFCEESGYSYEWKEHQNPHLIKKMAKEHLAHAITSCLSSSLVYQVKHTLRVQQKIQLKRPRS